MKFLSELPVGSKVKFGNYKVEGSVSGPMVWLVADKNHAGYPANSVTLLTEKMIDLRGFDAKEPSNSNADRQSSGNNRYLHSNLRQWLNKSGHPWYAATHGADAPPNDAGMSQPTGYDDEPGFLSNFSNDELGGILNTTLTVARNTVTDGGGSEVVTDKVFLLSNTEIGLANENSIVEGSLLPLFSNDASRIAKLTQQAFINTKSTSKPTTVNDGWYWWLRTPCATFSRVVRSVGSSGTLFGNNAYYGFYGVRPALNLKSGILVSDLPDGDGCYNFIWAMPHLIKLDKVVTVNVGDIIEKIKFGAKLNGLSLNLKSVDIEKLIYEAIALDTDIVSLEIEGKDGKIGKVAYVIS